VIGGAPAEGGDTGAGRNYAALVDQCYQFDFYDGGGIDLAFLSAAEVDVSGNVNISRFGDKIIGVGGFVNISQNAKKVVFSGTLTAGKLAVDCGGGKVQILREGEHRKFVKSVSQISYNGNFARERRQQVLFVTERAVFRLADVGLELVEVAPGVSVQEEVLALMDFTPSVSPNLKLMDARIFRPEPMDIASELQQLTPWRHPRLSAV
jgi:propionate CoA-transferase